MLLLLDTTTVAYYSA